jgi:hypothetical protein
MKKQAYVRIWTDLSGLEMELDDKDASKPMLVVSSSDL